jgi:hypothetical protein
MKLTSKTWRAFISVLSFHSLPRVLIVTHFFQKTPRKYNFCANLTMFLFNYNTITSF